MAKRPALPPVRDNLQGRGLCGLGEAITQVFGPLLVQRLSSNPSANQVTKPCTP